jgi:hypothetical protein
MSLRTVAAFLAGALAASTGTALALTKGHVFRLQEGDEANYGVINCEARHVAPYRTLECWGARTYRVTYGASEVRVYRSNRQVFAAKPSGR